MTWIAACNGQRGIHQKLTDKERQELCEWLYVASIGWNGSAKMAQAADELKRLAKENRRLKAEIWDLEAELELAEGK